MASSLWDKQQEHHPDLLAARNATTTKEQGEEGHYLDSNTPTHEKTPAKIPRTRDDVDTASQIQHR